MSATVSVIPLSAINPAAATTGWDIVSPSPAAPLNAFSAESATPNQSLSALDPSGAFNVESVPSIGAADPAFVPDVALPDTHSIHDVPVPNAPRDSAADMFAQLLAQSTQAFSAAQKSEAAVVHGQGSILDMSVDRARADALLGVAATGAARFSSMLQTFMNMAV